MNINSVTSDLNYLSTQVTDLQIENNIWHLKDEYQRTLGMNIELVDILSEEDSHYAELVLAIEIEVKGDEDKSASIKMEITGRFSRRINVEIDAAQDERSFIRMVMINGGAALYSVARGKLESITAAVFSSGKITIPFVNIIEYYQEKMKSETSEA